MVLTTQVHTCMAIPDCCSLARSCRGCGTANLCLCNLTHAVRLYKSHSQQQHDLFGPVDNRYAEMHASLGKTVLIQVIAHVIVLVVSNPLIHLFFFFFNDPPPPEISPLSLHDLLPI